MVLALFTLPIFVYLKSCCIVNKYSLAVFTNVLVLYLEASRIGSGRIALHAGILKPSAIRMSIDSFSRGSIHSGPS